MPISRDPRTDRRRRLRLEGYDGLEQSPANTRAKSRNSDTSDTETGRTKRSAGYSQEVRRACGQRLVQLIPVRRRSFALVVTVSLLVPSMLLLGHYLVYVLGKPRWYGHPLATLLDLSHQNGLATWLSSHMWLLCLTATVLTFQLRRHKLDDYEGEYRLWFWLVMTCLLASIDSTTKVSHLFGLALESWTQLNLGWSGPAVVQSTLIVLVGMLGLRLCTELKTVPLSLVFWLTGLVAWCASTILSQDLLRVELTAQFRMWLRCSLWLGGLTCVWLAALTYLRHVYIEAQKRFLARGRLATAAIPLRERIRESMPQMPTFRRNSEEGDEEGSRWGVPAFWRKEQEETEAAEPKTQKRRTNTKQAATDAASSAANGQSSQAAGNQAARDSEPEAEKERKPSRLTSWIRKPKDSDEPDEYKKVVRKPRSERTSGNADSEQADGDNAGDGKSWLSKLPRPKLPKPSMPSFGKRKSREESSQVDGEKSPASKRDEPNESAKPKKEKSGGFFSKLKLPSFRLPPPSENEESGADGQAGQKSKAGMRPVNQQGQLPGTHPADSANGDDSERPNRPLTKAERKRLRRQKQNRAA